MACKTLPSPAVMTATGTLAPSALTSSKPDSFSTSFSLKVSMIICGEAVTAPSAGVDFRRCAWAKAPVAVNGAARRAVAIRVRIRVFMVGSPLK